MGVRCGKTCRDAMILQNTAHPPAVATLPPRRFSGQGHMSPNLESQLKKAQKALASQKFAEARDAFRQVMMRFPGNARAKRGYWLSQSALADSGFAANHPPRRQLDDIAAALGTGRAEDAASMAGTLLSRFPLGHGLHNLLGVAQATLGNQDEAVAAFRAAIELKPTFLEARNNLASRMIARGDFEGALPLISDSLEMAPENGPTLNAMTVCLIGLRRFEEALSTAQRAVKAHPDDAAAHNNLGLCQRHARRLDDAIASYRRALKIAPDHIDATLNLGAALVRVGQAEAAINTYRQGLETRDTDSRLHSNLGLALIETRQMEQAIAAFDKALDLDPDHVDASFNRFIAMALNGQLHLAWPHAECRFDSRRTVPVENRYRGSAPAWDGKASLAGKTLLVHAEQGLGDTLMFMRYMSQLPAETGHVRLAVQDPLRTLIEAQDMPFEVVSLDPDAGDDAVATDHQCPLMSLPLILEARATVPSASPYVTAPDARRKAWQERLGVSENPRVGFVFRGNPDHVNDINRSIDLALFLSALPPGLDYHFLGIDLRHDEAALLARRGDVRTHCDDLADFCDTAALVSLMDRVVCVDTSIAHLAGALGIETHILLAFTPDWRWGLESSDSDWYPSVTLHRQTTPGNWQPVLATLHARLASVT